jgi:eukaryotic-like serine/threonine-protein kinase
VGTPSDIFSLGTVLAFAATGEGPFGAGSSDALLYRVIHTSADNGNVYALSAATGALRWKLSTGSSVVSRPAVADGTVYVGSENTDVYALDAATGAIRWRRPTGGQVNSSPAVSGQTIFVGSDDGKVHALNTATGN